MKNQYFTTTGDKDSGTYIVYEFINGRPIESCKIEGEYYQGLKKARQSIGKYLINKYGYSLDKVVTHQTTVQGRQGKTIRLITGLLSNT